VDFGPGRSTNMGAPPLSPTQADLGLPYRAPNYVILGAKGSPKHRLCGLAKRSNPTDRLLQSSGPVGTPGYPFPPVSPTGRQAKNPSRGPFPPQSTFSCTSGLCGTGERKKSGPKRPSVRPARLQSGEYSGPCISALNPAHWRSDDPLAGGRCWKSKLCRVQQSKADAMR
jgi:hypothetical protein